LVHPLTSTETTVMNSARTMMAAASFIYFWNCAGRRWCNG